jgi:hypothetical protein
MHAFFLRFQRVTASEMAPKRSDARKNHLELKLHSNRPLTVLEAVIWNLENPR